MESSRQKTFKPHRTIQIISAVFFFILFIYPTLFIADQFKGVRVTDGEAIRGTNDGRVNIVSQAEIDSLAESGKLNEYRRISVPESLKYITGSALNKTLEIKLHDIDRYRRIVGEGCISTTYFNLAMVKAGGAEHYCAQEAAETPDVLC